MISMPMILPCPVCRFIHVDRGEWRTKPHSTHLCEECGHTWKPYDQPTVGVASLT